jgi:hypothetical protein
MLGMHFGPKRGYWVLSAPGFHLQGETECYDLWSLWDRARADAYELAAKRGVAVPDGAELEIQKYAPPKSWRADFEGEP